MANCKRPIPMYMGVTGKATMFLKQAQRPLQYLYDIDCGRCINCRIKKSGEIAARVMLECRQVEDIADKMKYPLVCRPLFLTLTYSDDCLPIDERVCKEHLKKFFVDLKKIIPVRYIASGEYGSRTGRAHYHAIIWPASFFESRSMVFSKVSDVGGSYDCYSCPDIENLWKFGNVRINLCTPETIAYVAKYVLKKMTGQLESSKHVTRYGEEVKRDSGFFLYSLRPGIGAYISDDVCKQFLRDGYIVYKNARLALPRYIKIVLTRRFPLEYDAMIDRLVDSSKKLDFEAREVRENKGFQSDRARSKIAEKLKSLSSDKSKF